jgi:hypothetical protein
MIAVEAYIFATGYSQNSWTSSVLGSVNKGA